MTSDSNRCHGHLITRGKQEDMATLDAAHANVRVVAFGSTQERKIFPVNCAPDCMGNRLRLPQRSPALGPGCYDNHVMGSVIYNLEKKPESKKGYSLGARTTPRFPPPVKKDGCLHLKTDEVPLSNVPSPRTAPRVPLVDGSPLLHLVNGLNGCCAETVTPSPEKYQLVWGASRGCSPGRTPFNSSTQRFRSNPAPVSNPGPGAYEYDAPLNRKVSWPMKFGSPDWSRVPQLERRAFHTELPCDKEYKKQRNRVAYLQLFYS